MLAAAQSIPDESQGQVETSDCNYLLTGPVRVAILQHATAFDVAQLGYRDGPAWSKIWVAPNIRPEYSNIGWLSRYESNMNRSVNSPVRSAAAFLAITIAATILLILLVWRGAVEPSPRLLVLAVTGIFAAWAAKPHRLILNSRVYGVLLACFLVAIGFLLAGGAAAHRVSKAVSVIQLHGGTVQYDYQWTDDAQFKTKHGWVFPSRILDFLGDPWFADVSRVYLGSGAATDDNIERFDLDHFPSVEFTNSPITDSSLEHLAKCKKLKSLGLSGTEVTDAGIHHLVELNHLTELYLMDTDISDECIETLAQLTNLCTLVVRNTNISAEGVVILQNVIRGCEVVY